MTVDLEMLEDPGAFLAAAGEHLAEDPVSATVITTVTDRLRRERSRGLSQPGHDWWLVVRDGTGRVVGVGMRTARHGARPAFLLPMPDEAARALAGLLHERGEVLSEVNGALPATRVFADAVADRTSRAVEVVVHTRLHRLDRLVEPRPVAGRLAAAEVADAGLVVDWFAAFARDADVQAGRRPGTMAHEAPAPEDVLRRIAERRLWFWVDDDGRRLHLTGVNPPAFGVARIGPVYTPNEERGRGWASATVGAVSRRLLAEGIVPCLFTDQANPTSNHVYRALGYTPVVDMVNLRIRARDAVPPPAPGSAGLS